MNKVTLKYDVPAEVSEKAFNVIMNDWAGVCAGKFHDGKYLIKLWIVKYSKYIKAVMAKYPLSVQST